MAELNIPNLNMNSNKYIFKKKFNLKRKSKKTLFIESAIMFFLSLFLVYINYLIPNKNLLIQNLPNTLNKTFLLIIDLFSNLLSISLVIFVFISLIISFIFFMGSIYRIFRIAKKKSRVISYK